MIKKLAVPALVLAMAGFGCSSSTTSTTTGSGGTAGHSTGGSSTGGSAVAGSSGGGHPGGGSSVAGNSGGGTSGGGTSGGGTAGGGHPGPGGHPGGGHPGGGTAGGGTSGGGTSGGGTSGGGTSGGGTSGGGVGGGVQVMANCNVTTQDGTSVLSDQVFCDNFLANCPTTTGYTDVTTCKASYGANSVTRRNCQSYHLCWGVEGVSQTAGLANPGTHCPHAAGAAPCGP